MKTNYSNKQLAEDLLEVVDSISYKVMRKQSYRIQKAKVNIAEYYNQHESLRGLPVKLGPLTKKTIEEILTIGKEAAREKMINKRLQNINEKIREIEKNSKINFDISRDYGAGSEDRYDENSFP